MSNVYVDISRNDISVSHRLPKSRTMSERPIIVKFVRRNTKTALMANKKTLRSIDRYRHTYVNDDLTPLRSRMLRTLKNDDEVKRVWTIDGIFHCIVVENNAEVKKRLETTILQIYFLIQNITRGTFLIHRENPLHQGYILFT